MMNKTSFLFVIGLCLCSAACKGEVTQNGEPDATSPDSGSADVSTPDVANDEGGRQDADPVTDATMDTTRDATSDADAPSIDICNGQLVCEQFDDYPNVTALSDGQTFGPWRTAHRGASTAMLDTTRSASGSTALRVSIDPDADGSGARLFTDIANTPTQLHGRMMMYIEENGHSVHWTFGGVSGGALPPLDGRQSTYLFSALRTNDMNTFSTVNYINTNPAQDCWNRSETMMEAGKWMCLEWSVDTANQTIDMKLDGQPLLSVSGTGQGCVGNVANDSAWVGPAIDQFYVGYWSFHPFTGAFDAWIDDVIIDDEPVSCPTN